MEGYTYMLLTLGFLFSTFIQAAGKETGSGICEAPPSGKGD